MTDMIAPPEDLDRMDLRILAVLQRDGRISNLKLAEAVALSPTAVLARVQRLTKDGYIAGYEARLNPQKLGAAMLVFVEVLLDRTTPNVFDQFKAAVQVYPKSWNATWWRAVLTTCSRPVWPTCWPTATARARCCGNCTACAKHAPMR